MVIYCHNNICPLRKKCFRYSSGELDTYSPYDVYLFNDDGFMRSNIQAFTPDKLYRNLKIEKYFVGVTKFKNTVCILPILKLVVQCPY